MGFENRLKPFNFKAFEIYFTKNFVDSKNISIFALQ